MLVELPQQTVKAEGLLNAVLGPVAEPGITALPFFQPGQKVAPGLGEIAPIVEPSKFLQAVVIGPSRQVIARIAQEIDIATLPDGFGQELGDRPL